MHVAEILDFYVSRMNYWENFYFTIISDDLAAGYKEGVDWINNINPAWQELIGASKTYNEFSGMCQCNVNTDDYEHTDVVPENIGPCETLYCTVVIILL